VAGVKASMGKEEARWRAEADLESLNRAQEVMADPTRLNKAKAIAAQRAAETAKQAAKLRKISGTKPAAKRGR